VRWRLRLRGSQGSCCSRHRAAKPILPATPIAWRVFIDQSAPDVLDQCRGVQFSSIARNPDSDTAFAIDAAGPGALAGLCAERPVPLIHMSTDCVFDGVKPESYDEDDAPDPVSVYGLLTSWLASAPVATPIQTR